MHPLTNDEVTHGVESPELGLVPIVGAIADAHLHVVDSTIPLRSRRSLARVAYAAQRSTPNYQTGYDGTVTDDDQRLYILGAGSRAIGLVLTALQDRFWNVRWNEHGYIARDGAAPILRRGPMVARIWVAQSERRSGLGLRMTSLALQHLGVAAGTVGWEFPFTESGSAIVRRLCPDVFLVGCDAMTLARHTKPHTVLPSTQ